MLASWAKNGDAVIGDGVYFTRKHPELYSKEEIFENNWNRSLSFSVDANKMDVCIEIEYLGENMVSSRSVGSRDVWVYLGEDMQLLANTITTVFILPPAESLSARLRELLTHIRKGGAELLSLVYPQREESIKDYDLSFSTQAQPSIYQVAPSPVIHAKKQGGSSSSGSGGGFWWLLGGLAVGVAGGTAAYLLDNHQKQQKQDSRQPGS